MVRYLCGFSKSKPALARFGYVEKMEYWAVVWGTIIMGITGVIIWFKMEVTHFLPRWAVDVALAIHYYEAILACLAILVWHFYHIIFDPDIYPINWAFWDGKVSNRWYRAEHLLDTDPTKSCELRPLLDTVAYDCVNQDSSAPRELQKKSPVPKA